VPRHLIALLVLTLAAAPAARAQHLERDVTSLQSTLSSLAQATSALDDAIHLDASMRLSIARATVRLSDALLAGTRSPADGPTPIPPAPWAQRDSADSLYRVAREALNRGEYRRSAELFQSIGDRYPRSAYAPDALYWRAFSLYRVGGVDDLQLALRTLETQRERFPQAPAKALADADALASRIRGALATRGDVRVLPRVARDAARADTTCDREDAAVRVEALSALGQLDPEAATPLLRRVLARRDACSASLRRRALFLLGKRADSTSAPVLVQTFVDVARSDPDGDVREDATLWLARVPGDRSVAALEELLRTSADERTQRAAIRAIGSSANPRARAGLRALLERTDASERLRSEALGAFVKERATPEDGAFLRGYYARAENARLKERTVQAIARLGGAENERWLNDLAANPREPVALRAAVLRRSTMSAVPIAELARLYASFGERELREVIVSQYARRKEPEATDRLLEIVRTGTDPELRRTAISALAGKNDPRTTKLLMEIVDR
jgi:HEAT repeat protein